VDSNELDINRKAYQDYCLSRTVERDDNNNSSDGNNSISGDDRTGTNDNNAENT